MTKPKQYEEFARIGRPPNTGPKPVVINILIDPEVKEKLKSLASKAEVSLSSYVADYLTKLVRKK
jgi:predicted HicB family RNase H-like nuclease